MYVTLLRIQEEIQPDCTLELSTAATTMVSVNQVIICKWSIIKPQVMCA